MCRCTRISTAFKNKLDRNFNMACVIERNQRHNCPYCFSHWMWMTYRKCGVRPTRGLSQYNLSGIFLLRGSHNWFCVRHEFMSGTRDLSGCWLQSRQLFSSGFLFLLRHSFCYLVILCMITSDSNSVEQSSSEPGGLSDGSWSQNISLWR